MRLCSITADGSKYYGEFFQRSSIKDGVGYLINADGSIFEGAFENDIPKRGRYIKKNGKVHLGELSLLNAKTLTKKDILKNNTEEETNNTSNSLNGEELD